MIPYLTKQIFDWQRPDESYVRPVIKDNGDGTFTVSYTPDDLGPYTVDIKFGGKEVPGSPFPVNACPVGDASKCRITGTVFHHRAFTLVYMLPVGHKKALHLENCLKSSEFCYSGL